MNNSSANRSTTRYDNDLYYRIFIGHCFTYSFYILIGTPLCVWFLAAILSSSDMRRRLRNQLLCSIWLISVLRSSIGGAAELSFIIIFKHNFARPPCELISFIVFYRNVLEFATTWAMIALLIVYLAQLRDYDATATLTPMAVTIAKVVILVAPVIVGSIALPSIASTFNAVYMENKKDCLAYDKEHFIIFRTLDYSIPLIISVVLLVVAAVLYYRRYHRGFSSSSFSTSTRGEMMSRGPRVDNIFAYVYIIGIDIACRFPFAIAFVEFNLNVNQRMVFISVVWTLMDARAVLSPWGMLFLEDIRERIKVWRPWYRPGPGIDLSVAYNREEGIDK